MVAEREREVLVERIKAGLARVRAAGRVGGRKPTQLEWTLFEELTRQGLKMTDIAPRVGVSYTTLLVHVKRRLKESRRP
jgi:DNA invertase Pin-like site-specific DNA recombinase